MSFGPPAGSPFAGPSATQTSAAAGLPFAGMPSELADGARKILSEEPDHPEPDIGFSQSDYDREPFTLRRFLRPHRRGLAGALTLVVIETLALQAGPLLTQIGLDRAVIPRDGSALVLVAVAYLIAVLTNTVASTARVAYTGRLGERLMYQLRIRVFSHFQRQSLDFFTSEKVGVLLTRMTSDIDALAALFQDGLVNLMVQVLTLVIITVVLFVLSPTLALITLLAVVPAMLLLTLWFRSASELGYRRVRERIADVLADLSESLAGMRVITATNRRQHNVIQHANVVGEHRDANIYASTVGSIYGPSSEFIGLAGQAALLFFGGRMVLDGTLSIGELFAFLLYLTAFFAPIQQLVQLYNSYQQGQAALAKIRGLLATEPSVVETPDAVELPPIDGRVVFDNVSFSYDGEVEVLTDFNLTIEPGETVAIVGPTGAGKSTAAKLLSRFYEPTTGSVSIDGHDIRSVTLSSLRSQLGVVPQEPFLFNGSIRRNVGFSDPSLGIVPGGGASNGESSNGGPAGNGESSSGESSNGGPAGNGTPDAVQQACDEVGLTELISRLPQGLDSPVHERGASLSSGERQLLALARAFLARPRVLILDEATSNLDLASETLVERALDRVLEGRTAIIVAHRLATAMRADRIAVINDGRLVELGSHQDLVERGGHYAEMFALWEAATG
ncbi:MAG: ABC transporter ATP-binding protein [Actinomycetota bacterium]